MDQVVFEEDGGTEGERGARTSLPFHLNASFASCKQGLKADWQIEGERLSEGVNERVNGQPEETFHCRFKKGS